MASNNGAMCGRFSQLPIHLQAGIVRAMREEGARADLLDDLAQLQPKYNLAPTQEAGVVADTPEGLMLHRLKWGLLPFWAKDKKLGYTTINARVETVASKPAFRSAFKERRALVPMAGHFEWTEPKPKIKQPWFVHRPDGKPLCAAALWEPRHKLQTEEDRGTFTIITTTAQKAAGDVHDRMPVILPFAEAEEWMRETPTAAQAMLDSFVVPPVAVYPVSRRVNAPKDDDPALIERISNPSHRVMGSLPAPAAVTAGRRARHPVLGFCMAFCTTKKAPILRRPFRQKTP